MRVVVGGNIAVGKSTVMDMLQRRVPSTASRTVFVDPEPIEAMRPFLDRMYGVVSPEERSLNIFMIQCTVAMHFIERIHHVDAYARANADKQVVHFVERSMVDAEDVFLRANVDNGQVSATLAEMYLRMRRMMCPDEHRLGDPKARVTYALLEAPVDTCYERTMHRARGEEVHMSRDYLQQIHSAHLSMLEALPPRVATVRVDCGTNTPTDVVRLLLTALRLDQ